MPACANHSDSDSKVGTDHDQQADAATTASDDSGDDATNGGDHGDETAVPSQVCATISAQIVAATGNTISVAPGKFGEVMVNGKSTTLREVVLGAKPGDTILLADGTYTFYRAGTEHGDYTGLYFTKNNVTLRSASGNAQAVILDSNYVNHGGETALITIGASGVVVADITVKRSIYHLIHLWSGADDVRVHHVRLEDGGQQFIKASAASTNIDNAEVSCSQFIMTKAGRTNVWGYGEANGATRCYTGGIDTHGARSWRVHDNRFEGIYCDGQHPAHGLATQTYSGGLAEHAIHMWDAEQGHGHLIERNQIIDCARGIGLGMAGDVYDTVVRNNTVYSSHAGGSEHDVGINVERGHNIKIDNNTVFFSSPNAYANAIEYRYASTNLSLRNNLTNKAIRARDDAEATLSNNLATAQSSWFPNLAAGDLHLASCEIAGVTGKGLVLANVTDDIDQQKRDDRNDIGADQCGQ